MPDNWTIPAKSFDSQTLTGTLATGTEIDYDEVMTDHSAELTVAWGPSDVWVVGLQGSLDGVDWYDLVLTPGGGFFATLWNNGSAPGSTSSASNWGTCFGQPARFVRATGKMTAGSGPVVTVVVTSR